MNEIKLLIEDYTRRLDSVNELMKTQRSNGSIVHQRREERLNTKASEYRSIISDLERIQEKKKSEFEQAIDEAIDRNDRQQLRDKILAKSTEYANDNWSVYANPNEHDRAHDDFSAGAMWVLKNFYRKTNFKPMTKQDLLTWLKDHPGQQRKLEQEAELAQGYISKIKNGSMKPSRSTLKLLDIVTSSMRPEVIAYQEYQKTMLGHAHKGWFDIEGHQFDLDSHELIEVLAWEDGRILKALFKKK